MTFQRNLLNCVMRNTVGIALFFVPATALPNDAAVQKASDEVGKAHVELEQGYGEYFKALVKKPKATPAEKADLKKEILHSRRNRVLDTMKAQSTAIGKNSDERVQKQLNSKDERKTKTSKKKPNSKGEKPKPTKPTKIQPPAPEKEKVILDGSNIPKELEFVPASPQPQVAPKPQPSVVPSPAATLSIESANSDPELTFPGRTTSPP